MDAAPAARCHPWLTFREGGRKRTATNMLRCPLCAGTTHKPLRGNYLRCTLCSLAFIPDGSPLDALDSYRPSDGHFVFPNWNSLRTRLTKRLPSLPRKECYFSPLAVRMFAAREGRRVVRLASDLPLLPIAAPWLRGENLRAELETVPDRPAGVPDSRLTLGIIAATDAWADVLAQWADVSACASRIVVVLDTLDAALAAQREAEIAAVAGGRFCRVIAHPLAQDFAAQRNLVQHAATTEWVLHLDCDERLTAGIKRIVSSVLDDAENQGWSAIGLTRRNMVDGTASALYPDVQYRLVRNSVSYTRAVHEYPDLQRGQSSFIHLRAGIVHTLASTRFAGREAYYEAIQAGASRPYDSEMLLRPLQNNIVVTA